MLLFSSLHIHPDQALTQDECTDCVAHHCGGHIGQQTLSFDACVLCQFQTFSFVAAAVFAVVLFHQLTKELIAQRQRDVHLDVCGIPLLRAPPFFS